MNNAREIAEMEYDSTRDEIAPMTHEKFIGFMGACVRFADELDLISGVIPEEPPVDPLERQFRLDHWDYQVQKLREKFA